MKFEDKKLTLAPYEVEELPETLHYVSSSQMKRVAAATLTAYNSLCICNRGIVDRDGKAVNTSAFNDGCG